jgi:hypothetical protein
VCHKLSVIKTKKFILFRVPDADAIRQYVAASDAYFAEKALGAKQAFMQFPFPNVVACCLLCDRAGCARWKGYFVRQWICSVLGLGGAIAIHVGHCRTQGCDFSYFPDFLIPGKRLSRQSWQTFVEEFQRTKVIKNSIDNLVCGVEIPDFTLPLSTAYNFLYAAIRPLRMHHSDLSIIAPTTSSVGVYYGLPKLVIKNLFGRCDFGWHALHHITLQPP